MNEKLEVDNKVQHNDEDTCVMKSKQTCPSAPAIPGAQLLGILGGDGRIASLRTPVQVDADFLHKASQKGPVERRMRFASPCQESGCAQWNAGRCTVVDKVMDTLDAPGAPRLRKKSPPCMIRGTCRWFSQIGERACLACELVVTDTRQNDRSSA